MRINKRNSIIKLHQENIPKREMIMKINKMIEEEDDMNKQQKKKKKLLMKIQTWYSIQKISFLMPQIS